MTRDELHKLLDEQDEYQKSPEYQKSLAEMEREAQKHRGRFVPPGTPADDIPF